MNDRPSGGRPPHGRVEDVIRLGVLTVLVSAVVAVPLQVLVVRGVIPSWWREVLVTIAALVTAVIVGHRLRIREDQDQGGG